MNIPIENEIKGIKRQMTNKHIIKCFLASILSLLQLYTRPNPEPGAGQRVGVSMLKAEPLTEL